MADELAVWMNGVNVAVVQRERNRFRLTYTDAALGLHELGVPLLSLSLPLTNESYPQGVVKAFFDGLLPEGVPRREIAREFNIRENDTFALIRALGRDCAGALVVQPVDEPPPIEPTTATAQPLTDDELADLVTNLHSAPLGAGGRVRISLAGVQEKLLLTRMPDGAWGRPIDGTPSTHILKPEIAAYPNTVENEAFCMRIARNLGLDVAAVETTTIAERKLIVVERFDRVVNADGSIVRIHQEDFCQAKGIPPDRKYQEDGGPSLREIADVLQVAVSMDTVEAFLRALVLNVVIGNGDAHAKNYSLLHNPPGSLRLAPLYDLMSTLYYRDDRLAMYVDDVRRTDRVTADRIVNEGVSWGLPRQRSSEIVVDLLDRVQPAVEAALDETDGVPGEIRAVARSQLKRLT